MLIDPSIQDFYAQSDEENRLRTGLGPLEFSRNKQLISRYLTGKSLLIADIGGGTGHYSQWLAGLEHRVILVDPVENHIQLAKKRSNKSRRPFTCILGEARDLSIETSSMDLVILHGPLYHLQERCERLAALKEAGRILRPGGVVIGFAITYPAFTLAALHNGMFHQAEIYDMCKDELVTGEHEPPDIFSGMLPKAFLHKPDQFVKEFEDAGFCKIELCAVEGFAWLDSRFFESWSTPLKQQRLLDILTLTESDPDLLCISPHIMLAAEFNIGI